MKNARTPSQHSEGVEQLLVNVAKDCRLRFEIKEQRRGARKWLKITLHRWGSQSQKFWQQCALAASPPNQRRIEVAFCPNDSGKLFGL